MRRALTALADKDIRVQAKGVPAHVGIYCNDRADRLGKVTTRRTRLVTAHTTE